MCRWSTFLRGVFGSKCFEKIKDIWVKSLLESSRRKSCLTVQKFYGNPLPWLYHFAKEGQQNEARLCSLEMTHPRKRPTPTTNPIFIHLAFRFPTSYFNISNFLHHRMRQEYEWIIIKCLYDYLNSIQPTHPETSLSAYDQRGNRLMCVGLLPLPPSLS